MRGDYVCVYLYSMIVSCYCVRVNPGLCHGSCDTDTVRHVVVDALLSRRHAVTLRGLRAIRAHAP